MEICKKELCSGCAVCAYVCPKGAISVIRDPEGFQRPHIDPDKCVECGLCHKTCPVNERSGNAAKEAYAAYSRDKEIRKGSSSGGVFTHLAKKILSMGGVVIGAGLSEGMKVQHICVEDESELWRLRGSKYVQSDTDGIYEKIEKYLKDGREVLFSGTPCQCAAVRGAFVEREGLVLCDFICHGVPTPALWEKYINERFPSARSASFRNKDRGWEEFSMSIEWEKGVYSCSQYKDPYLRIFLRDIPLRPSCYSCCRKGEGYSSDITLADFWGISKVYPHMNDDKGTSAVIVRSERGSALYESLSGEIVSQKTDAGLIRKINVAHDKSARCPDSREGFFQALSGGASFAELEKEYFVPVSGTEIMKIRVKRTIKKLLGKIYSLKAGNR